MLLLHIEWSLAFRPSSSNKELSCVLFFAERKEETRLRHRVRRTIILVSYLIESRCPDPVMCKRSGSAASPDMKDSVTKFKIPQTGANIGRASPLASSSESQLWLRVQRHIWHRRRECRLDLDLHVTKTINYGCSEVRFRQYAEKREDFSPNLFQDEYSKKIAVWGYHAEKD